uniref:WASH complex subunit 3 n=1 Tax=Petromyzon marinus TaxID=7757 RepID=S4RGL3_PETMA
MDADGLPIVGTGTDLTKVGAINQKRTLAFLNHFIVHTTHFLNRFSCVCEEKLTNLALRIQQIETTLNILEAKLASIPGLEDVKVSLAEASSPFVSNDSHVFTVYLSTSSENGQNRSHGLKWQSRLLLRQRLLTVAKDPRYARYLKMVQVGVPVLAIRNKMIADDLDPELLNTPDAPVPDSGISQKAESDSGEASSDSESGGSFSD